MADNSTILEKLDGLVARFEEISTLITDPSVIADQKRYVKLTKEYKELDDLMKARKEYIQLLGNIEEAKSILASESDAEMREMAKEEMDNSQERLPVLEEEIKLMLLSPPTRRTARMRFLKSVAVQVVTRRLSLPATSSVCMPNSAKQKAGKWKSPMRTKERQADSRKLFAASQVTMFTES